MKSVAEPVASTSSLPEEAKPQRPLLGVREVSQGQLLVMLKHSQSSFWHLDPATCDLQQREGHVETLLLFKPWKVLPQFIYCIEIPVLQAWHKKKKAFISCRIS